MIGLGQFLDENWDAVEADFQHYYQLDLRRVIETDTARRAHVLVAHLPWGAFARPPEDTTPAMPASSSSEIAEFFGRHLKGG